MESFQDLIKDLSLDQLYTLLKKYIEIKDRMYLSSLYNPKNNDKELEEWFEIIIPQLKEYICQKIYDL